MQKLQFAGRSRATPSAATPGRRCFIVLIRGRAVITGAVFKTDNYATINKCLMWRRYSCIIRGCWLCNSVGTGVPDEQRRSGVGLVCYLYGWSVRRLRDEIFYLEAEIVKKVLSNLLTFQADDTYRLKY